MFQCDPLSNIMKQVFLPFFTNKLLGKGVLSKEPRLQWPASQSPCSELHAAMLPHFGIFYPS